MGKQQPVNYTKSFELNKTLWDAKTPFHEQSEFYDNDAFLNGQCTLHEEEIEAVGAISGKRLLHLQCHFGQDTLSWARRGAQVTGVDLSEEAIKLARKLSDRLGLESRFECCNVLDTRDHVREQFDVVFTSYGTIGWLPNLDPWADVVADSLVSGGRFVIIDFHPFLWMLDSQFEQFHYPYWNRETIEEVESGTYADTSAPIELQSHSWNHPLSDLVSALLSKGLVLEVFREYDYSNYNCFPNMEEFQPGKWRFQSHGDRIPYMYLYRWRKP
ncbi:MAG: class I SAM-dependent methyltransferase [Flavobacteriales bacterium]|nr:class I SAM-dependent methyltransferase [Flavobacteriales bacterium]